LRAAADGLCAGVCAGPVRPGNLLKGDPVVISQDLTVVTRTTVDFARCGARCFDPWSQS